MIVLQLFAGMLEVKGAFLQGGFSNDEYDIDMTIPDGLQKKHPDNVWLNLLAPIYDLKNAAMAFWIKLAKVFRKLGCMRSLVDPCLHYYLTTDSMIMWLCCVDDCLHAGKQDEIDD